MMTPARMALSACDTRGSLSRAYNKPIRLGINSSISRNFLRFSRFSFRSDIQASADSFRIALVLYEAIRAASICARSIAENFRRRDAKDYAERMRAGGGT